jgi:lysophospholipase L1-like esterase
MSLVASAGPWWGSAVADADAAPVAYYLSLGDSLAQGYQPIGGPLSATGVVGYNQGYADQLLKLARHDRWGHLRLVKLGCGGETTATLIADSRCQYDAGSQLDEAVRFLDEHEGEVAFITVNIGANDIFECNGDPSCFVPQIASNLPHIVATLRQHAGPGVPIVGMNYYAIDNVAWFMDPAEGQAAAARTVGFNNFLESLFNGAGATVADVESAFAVSDFGSYAELPGFGPVPLSVYNTCTLTWVCARPPLGPDIHANNDGYGLIAGAFAAALGI